MLRRDPRNLFHRHALVIAFWVGGISALLQPISGDFLARQVARYQPIKLAAMEGQFETERYAPLRIGGLPDVENERTPFAIEIPAALSLLVHHRADGEIQGLKDFPRDEWPPVAIVHIAFQVMVACGIAMMMATAMGAWLTWRKRRLWDSPRFLWAMMLCGPLGFIAIEAGWTVTEVGRQPWIIYGIMRTADAVTPMPGIIVPFVTFTILYLFLAFVVVFLLKRQVFNSPKIFRPQTRSDA
jgi:cytochrome d ubiquinol oxidase subunit I